VSKKFKKYLKGDKFVFSKIGLYGYKIQYFMLISILKEFFGKKPTEKGIILKNCSKKVPRKYVFLLYLF
jgi:hypothetical protein